LRAKDLLPSVFAPEHPTLWAGPDKVEEPIVYLMPNNSSGAGRGRLISGTRRVIPTTVSPECLVEIRFRVDTNAESHADRLRLCFHADNFVFTFMPITFGFIFVFMPIAFGFVFVFMPIAFGFVFIFMPIDFGFVFVFMPITFGFIFIFMPITFKLESPGCRKFVCRRVIADKF
jgi:hypothetical protein